MSDDLDKYKSAEYINYITLQEGLYKGVSYKINNIEIIEEDEGSYFKFDYDVKGLDEGMEKEFERFLGEYLYDMVLHVIAEDVSNPKEIGV